MLRTVILAVVMAAIESAWALYAGKEGTNLGLFYGVLIAASLVFFIPGLHGKAAAKG